MPTEMIENRTFAEIAIGESATLSVRLDNVLNAHYSTFGVLGDPTGVGAPGIPSNGSSVDARFQSPAAPIAAYGGVKVRF